MKVHYGRIRKDVRKGNGDWEFDKLTRGAYADVTCKTEKEFNDFAERIAVHGYEPSMCPSIDEDSYSDTFYFDISDKKDFKESYKMSKD